MILEFPDFVPIRGQGAEAPCLEHFRAHSPVTSELTFTNLWMWQNHYHFEVRRLEGFLCFLSRPDEGEPGPDMGAGFESQRHDEVLRWEVAER